MNEEEDSFPNFHFLAELVSKGIISQKTMDKVKIGTSVIERKYKLKESQYNNQEKIFNNINEFFNEINYLSNKEKEEIKNSIYNKMSKYNRLTRQKITEKRFEIISNIGDGYLGQVKLVRDKLNNKIYAMKKLSIPSILRNSQLFHIKTEKDVLSMNNNNIWQTKLHYSFIDNEYLYFIIDYCPGEDFLNYLTSRNDNLTEEEAKFYIAEIILGVDTLHKNKCIHRDIKPENIFIDKFGHLKIGDFGLSILSNNIMYPYTYTYKNSKDEIYIEKNEIKNTSNPKKITGFSKVGSLMYVAPEVFENKSYGEEVDWWSVGIIFYEMLVGYTPFFDGKQEEIIERIKNFKQYLYIPKNIKNNLSEEAQQLIYDFLEDKDKRLGIGGIEEIKRHPFFTGFDWDNIRNIKPPFVPKPFRATNLDLKMNLKNNRLDLYSSKEIQNIRYNNLKSQLNKVDLNIYDFYYNKELVELKYNLDNNIVELIKKQINNYNNKIKHSINILEEINNEEIKSNPSIENNKIKNININNSSNFYNSEIKHKHQFLAFDKNDISENKNLKKKESIQIIPIRNLIFNNCRNMNYNNKKDLLYNSIRLGSSSKQKVNNFSSNKYNKINMTERKYHSKSVFKNDNINNINNTEIKIINKSKIKEKDKKQENNIKLFHQQHEQNKITNIENDKRRLKINGKLFTIKKNLGKYY